MPRKKKKKKNREKFPDLGFGNELLDITLKAQATNKKLVSWT